MPARNMEDLLGLDPYAFEDFVKKVFEGLGYKVDVTKRSGDEGVDLVLNRSAERSVVQCKRYRGQVGQSEIRDFYGTVIHEKAKRGFFVTTGTFSLPSQVWAEGKNLVLVDGSDLLDSILGLGIQVEAPARKPPSDLAPFAEAVAAAKDDTWRRSFEHHRYGLGVIFLGEPPKGHKYEELGEAIREALGAERYVFRREGLGETPLSLFGEPDRFGDQDDGVFDRLRNAPSFGFVDDIRDHDELHTLIVMRGDWLHFACSDRTSKGLDGFVEKAIEINGLAEARPFWEEIDRFGLIEVPAQSLDWSNLRRSLTDEAEAGDD